VTGFGDRREPGGIEVTTQSNEWRQLWPEHADQIEKATENLIRSLNSLMITAGNAVVEAAATEWVIGELRQLSRSDLDAEERFADESGGDVDPTSGR
jgi:hypothetical protein